ncbi:hypothetical protein AM571_PC00336 (plasmid) [Rhizobium etli 8C-3]|uniref:Uncharacterized protein n=2 Tax=Rhizobium TaxID=379 RepID=A0A4R3S006_9HYPH|nr:MULTISPECIES: hypothetical protein [Rhizobium]APO78076.1 hypothetical protein AM571_PC00336 [Rhizobium etli 8C-3]TCU31034.1 hypothetical protein EV130_101609 [Rhizobium azibense]TCU40944.1 hypothetical protein EV129_101231 [Rhizobium azibense]
MNVATNLALLLGSLTLTCWIVAGAVAVLGTGDELGRHDKQRVSELVSLGLNLVGFVCAVAMAAILLAA